MPLEEPEFASKVLQAWQGQLDFYQVSEYANQLASRSLDCLAAVFYQTWLDRNQTPHNHFVQFNLAVALSKENDLAGAEAAYRQAILLAPTFIQPRLNLGLILERQGRIDAALEAWLWVAQQTPETYPEQLALRIQALNHSGRVMETAYRYQEALAALTSSLALDPDQPDALHHWVFLRERLCTWPIYGDLAGVSPELMRRSTSALALLSLSDDPEAQLQAARNYVKDKMETGLPPLAPLTPYHHARLRIGYCSGDFCLHPVAMLTAELFELHDREKFEVYGFDWSREDGSALRRRVIQAMDHFIRIDKLDDASAARLIREHEIDILVDLQGQTLGARAGLMAHRPAPIQITYLGLPATTALPCIDYVIADRFLIPEELTRFYSEKPLYMPDVYQVSDRKRESGPPPSRQTCGLPPEGFVFCSFNNNFKFTPEVFQVWMNLLHRVEGSVLWLLGDNPGAQQNLRREAEARGIQGDRLLFAPRLAPEHYLARYTAADLFLDTFPFNAGTTASDALWMGLPVLTRSGRAFASRMAGALLTAAGLEELITYTLADYEEKAVSLAQDPAACLRIREQLRQVRASGVLFDTPRFVRNLETRLLELA